MTNTVEDIAQSLKLLNERLQRVEEKLDRLLAHVERGGTNEALPLGTTRATNSVRQLLPSKEDSQDAEDETTLQSSPGGPVRDEDGSAIAVTRSVLQDGPYVYEPLNANRSEIRILALYSATDESEDIVCELQKVELDSDQVSVTARSVDRFKALSTSRGASPTPGPKYNALSYHWGSSERSGHIILNGHHFAVTKNLEAALRQFRQIDANVAPQTRWWIDAICINQADIFERNSQVMLMRRIFKRAAAVSIWLGEEADDSSLALDTVVKVVLPPKKAPGEIVSISPTVSADQKLRCWKALWALYKRPWFGRAWVRQEIALSKFQTVYCGAYSCHFNDLKNVTLYLDYVYTQMMYRPLSPLETALRQPPYARLNSIMELADRTNMGSKYVEFSELLMHTRHCLATDLRDKVFSVLGMADAEKHRLQPDYRTSVADVFISATRCAIEASKRVDILSSCQSSGSRELPSWVPDYSKPWERRPFRAARHPMELGTEALFSGQALSLKGDFIDKVAEVSEHYVHGDEDSDQLEILVNRWKTFIKARKLPFDAGFELEKGYLKEMSQERSVDLWMRFFSLDDIRFSAWTPKYSSEGRPLLDPLLRMKLRPPRGYDSEHIKRLLLDDDFVDELEPLNVLHNCIKEYGLGRKLCLLHSGIIGLVPSTTQVDDTLAILHGAHYSSVLRQVAETEDTYSFVGEACRQASARQKLKLLTSS
ncbi:hypothetical protein MMC10_010511 [Thelotrema lepadinum]|nr:hypothetical protein [Thelotrema lepadinum]